MPRSWPTTAADATGRRRRARFEVRLHRVGGAWHVRHGAEGPVDLYACERAATAYAHEAARRAWVEQGTLSCVKVLSAEGTWEVVAVFGVSLPPR